MNTVLITYAYAGKPVRQRLADGYMSANDLCKFSTESINSFITNQYRIAMIDVLTHSLHVSRDQLIEIHTNDEVWIHPVAVDELLNWIGNKTLTFCARRWRDDRLLIPNHIMGRLLYIPRAVQAGLVSFKSLPDEIIEQIIVAVLVHKVSYIQCMVLNKRIWKLARAVWMALIRQHIDISPYTMDVSDVCDAISTTAHRSPTITYSITLGSAMIDTRRSTIIITKSEPTKLTTYNHVHINLYSEEMRVFIYNQVVIFINANDKYVPVRHYQCNHISHQDINQWYRRYGSMRTTLNRIQSMLTIVLPELLGSFILDP